MLYARNVAKPRRENEKRKRCIACGVARSAYDWRALQRVVGDFFAYRWRGEARGSPAVPAGVEVGNIGEKRNLAAWASEMMA